MYSPHNHYLYKYTYSYRYRCLYRYTSRHTFTCTSACRCAFTYIWPRTYIYTYMYICLYIHYRYRERDLFSFLRRRIFIVGLLSHLIHVICVDIDIDIIHHHHRMSYSLLHNSEFLPYHTCINIYSFMPCYACSSFMYRHMISFPVVGIIRSNHHHDIYTCI